jgi:folate-binding Fe-S cluster repair protein YgfZ
MPTVLLPDRAIVRVAGVDAISFIDGLVTCDMGRPLESA